MYIELDIAILMVNEPQIPLYSPPSMRLVSFDLCALFVSVLSVIEPTLVDRSRTEMDTLIHPCLIIMRRADFVPSFHALSHRSELR